MVRFEEKMARALDTETTNIVLSIEQELSARGFDQTEECIEVVEAGLTFLGHPYDRVEDNSSSHIDCSTLTSQSHWLGAVTNIPFIAENQRKASSGTFVGVDDLLPGDVAVKYRSVELSPDQTFNHVGLFLGWDRTGTGWIIEAAVGSLVHLTSISNFAAYCFKRFLPFPRKKFVSPESRAAIKLAPMVPKLGRFGARQYLRNGEGRFAHQGCDIYLPTGSLVNSPLTGELKIDFDSM